MISRIMFSRWPQRIKPSCRRLSSFPVWTCHVAEPKGPTVLLFGYAGSSTKQLDKFAQFYKSLGYSSLCAILPQEYCFHHDVPAVRACAHEMLDKLDEFPLANRDWIGHVFSNNGTALYQHCYYLTVEDMNRPRIKGLIVDSAPSPMGLRNYYIPASWIKNVESISFLISAYFLVNHANGINLKDSIEMVKLQYRDLSSNWSKHKSVPWVGKFLLDEETGDWPALFLFSKNDKLMRWEYNLAVALENSKRRSVTYRDFETSGHVAHYKTFPDQYTELVKNFLTSIK